VRRLTAILLVLFATAAARAQPAEDVVPAREEDGPTEEATPPDATEPAPEEAESGDPPRGVSEDDDWSSASDTEPEQEGADVSYVLESVRVEGNTRTRASVVRAYVPLEPGDTIDPDDDDLVLIAWALRGTGFFDRVQLRLERGERRGHVVLVVEVHERNAFVVQGFNIGVSEGLARTTDPNADVRPYVGATLADTNIFGTGTSLSVSGLMSERQQGIRVGFQDPRLVGSSFELRLAGFFNNARQYFGRSPFVSATCPPDAPEDCPSEIEAGNAVVFYRRGGAQIGFGRTVGTALHYSIDFQGEAVRVRSMPEVAAEMRGGLLVPIDFAIEPGTSFVSTLRFALLYDRRDDPALTTRGTFLRGQIEVGTRLLGSRYEFVRLQAQARGWVPIGSRHTLRFSAFAGLCVGDAPFFYKFHISDLSDLIPSRILEMEIDRRPALNVFGTSIELMRNEEFAARFDVQYDYSIYRGNGSRPVSGVNAYVNVGVYSLADLRDLVVAIPGYQGASRIPIDLTFDLGFRINTDIGTFDLAFANFLGFLRP
jgi:hypothetical protein